MIKFTDTVWSLWFTCGRGLAHFNSCLASRMHNDTISGRATLQCHDQKSWSRSQRHDPHPLSSSNVRIALIDSLWRLILSLLLLCWLRFETSSTLGDWWRFSKMSRFGWSNGSFKSQCHEQVLTSQLCGDPPLKVFEGCCDIKTIKIQFHILQQEYFFTNRPDKKKHRRPQMLWARPNDWLFWIQIMAGGEQWENASRNCRRPFWIGIEAKTLLFLSNSS